MTTDLFERLRALALSITQGDLRRPWNVQTSNSFRRIGTDCGDGNVLCAVIQQSDGHPDLLAASDVLDYIVTAHPCTILQLLHERDAARQALHIPQDLAENATGDATTEHPPISSYVLGQSVTFRFGSGKRWLSGIVTRLESGLRPDRSVWHTISVSSTGDGLIVEFYDDESYRVKPTPCSISGASVK